MMMPFTKEKPNRKIGDNVLVGTLSGVVCGIEAVFEKDNPNGKYVWFFKHWEYKVFFSHEYIGWYEEVEFEDENAPMLGSRK